MFTAKMILLEGFEPQECGARRFLYAGFLTVASNAPEISRLNEAALFIEAGHRRDKASKIFERSSGLETIKGLKSSLQEAAATILGVSHVEERAFGLLDGI